MSDDRPTDEQTLRSYLADRDTPCPSCGYNLRNAVGNVCPECNADLHLIVAATRDGITHYPRSAGITDTFGQLGLALGLITHAMLMLSFLATLETFYMMLAGVMLLVALVNALLWSLWVRRRAWLGRRLAVVHILLAFGGWWWIPAWGAVWLVAL